MHRGCSCQCAKTFHSLNAFNFRLYLRWNLIKKIENLEKLTTLQELELYDNQITEIENLDTLTNLE